MCDHVSRRTELLDHGEPPWLFDQETFALVIDVTEPDDEASSVHTDELVLVDRERDLCTALDVRAFANEIDAGRGILGPRRASLVHLAAERLIQGSPTLGLWLSPARPNRRPFPCVRRGSLLRRGVATPSSRAAQPEHAEAPLLLPRGYVSRADMASHLIEETTTGSPLSRAEAGPWTPVLRVAGSSPPALQQDRERQARGAGAPEQVTGLAEVCGRGGKLACLRLVEAELTKLLGAPTEDVIFLAEKRRLLWGCSAS